MICSVMHATNLYYPKGENNNVGNRHLGILSMR